MRDGFIKVAAVTPDIRVADCEYNAEQICKKMKEAAALAVRSLYFRSFVSPVIPVRTSSGRRYF